MADCFEMHSTTRAGSWQMNASHENVLATTFVKNYTFLYFLILLSLNAHVNVAKIRKSSQRRSDAFRLPVLLFLAKSRVRLACVRDRVFVITLLSRVRVLLSVAFGRASGSYHSTVRLRLINASSGLSRNARIRAIVAV